TTAIGFDDWTWRNAVCTPARLLCESRTSTFTCWPLMPPEALSCLKYAWAPSADGTPTTPSAPVKSETTDTSYDCLLEPAFDPPLLPSFVLLHPASSRATAAAIEVTTRSRCTPDIWTAPCI